MLLSRTSKEIRPTSAFDSRQKMNMMTSVLRGFALSSFQQSARVSGRVIRVTGSGFDSKQQVIAKCNTRGTASTSEASGSAPNPQRVVIVGGGFGGLYAAIRLTSLMWPQNKRPQITLIDKGDRFTFKPLMYELLNNTATEEEVAPYFSQLLAPYPVRFIQDRVLGVESVNDATGHSSGSVQLEGGGTLEYDWLVLALGSMSDDKGVPGVKEMAVPFNVYEDAVKVKDALESIEASANPSSTIMVVGAGYAGVELATVVAERMQGKASVMLVTPNNDILDGCPEGQMLAAKRVLDSLNAVVMAGTKVKQLSSPEASSNSQVPTSCQVDLEQADGSRRQMAADLVLWTAGASPATKGVNNRGGMPFPTSAKGSILTESTLRVREHPRVFALGDVSGAEAAYEDQGTAGTSGLPATAQVAFQQADYVAWNLWASMNNRTLLPFRYQHLGSMMALGQINAAVALPIPVPLPIKTTLSNSPFMPLLNAVGIKLEGNDPDSGVTVDGPLAAVMRRAAYLYRQPTNEQKLSVASSWLQQALEAASGKR